MTFEEAKKILEKEGFELDGPGKPHTVSEYFTEFEDPNIYEAMQVVSSTGYSIIMLASRLEARKARLKKEYEKNTKAPGPGEEQPKEGNPALKEAASQFNDALLDELRKKIAAYKKLHFYDTKTLKRKDEIIEELRYKNAELLGMVERMKEDVKDIDTNLNAANETNKCLNKKVVELTKIKGDLNSWISGLYFCIHHNNDNYKYKLKRLGKEISKLNSIIHDKNAVLADVAEELRLTKIREKNLAELGLKYVGENEKLKKELADKVVDKIDAQALKSAESALAYKEKVIAEKDEEIDKLTKENNDYKKVVEEFRNKIADMTIGKIDIQNIRLKEKDEVIVDLGKKLAATKKELEEKTNLVEVVRKGSKEYCDYGMAAEKMIQKMADVIVYDRPVFSKDFEQYRLWANGYRFNPQLLEIGEEEEKKFSPVKDTHPTEDNPEEVRMNEILEHVRKVLEEGGTVSTSYDKAEEGGDQSATIVQHRKSIVDLFKEIKRLWQE